MKTNGFGYSVLGSREKNQDAFLVDNSKSLYAVADGVGGGLDGEIAAQLAIEGIKEKIGSPDQIESVILELQETILSEAIRRHGEPLMGTTLTLALVTEQNIFIGHIGDSRAYLLRDNIFHQITENHESFDGELGNTVLASYLGIPKDYYPIQIFIQKLPAIPGDKLMLCSDGLYHQLNREKILKSLLLDSSLAESIVKNLCEEAEKNFELSDNVTVVYVSID